MYVQNFEIDEYYACIFYKTDYHTCQLHKHRKHDMIDFTIFTFANNLQDLIT